MSKQERDQSSWNEQELDSLLSQFFQQEMPEELQNPSVPVEVSARRAPTKKRRQQTGLFSIFAVTAVILLIVSVVWKPFQNPDNSDLGHSMPGVSGAISDLGGTVLDPKTPIPVASDILTAPHSLNYLFSSSPNSSEYTQFISETVERYETPAGPVEQRNTFYRTIKTVVDPQTGMGMALTISELQIDILL
ncbi:MAG: hypothetical protein IH899_22090, partial [Planctomycetes bacterium]|nr:hypothetical protein [Planctomycetota bacterium]